MAGQTTLRAAIMANDPDNCDIILHDSWNMYAHNPFDSDWTASSYKLIGNMSSVRDYLKYRTAVSTSLTKGMFFVMREHVFPSWDDTYNKDGGIISMKVLKDEVPRFWDTLLTRLLGERLVAATSDDDHVGAKDGDGETINGISISPKKVFCIVKLWTSGQGIRLREQLRIPDSYAGELFHTSNSDNISIYNVNATTTTTSSSFGGGGGRFGGGEGSNGHKTRGGSGGRGRH
jgi:hypothetical protein